MKTSLLKFFLTKMKTLGVIYNKYTTGTHGSPFENKYAHHLKSGKSQVSVHTHRSVSELEPCSISLLTPPPPLCFHSLRLPAGRPDGGRGVPAVLLLRLLGQWISVQGPGGLWQRRRRDSDQRHAARHRCAEDHHQQGHVRPFSIRKPGTLERGLESRGELGSFMY